MVLEAETDGWMVVGFNDEDTIVGADLKFVRVVDGVPELHDHHVVDVGDHRPDGARVEGVIVGHQTWEGRTRVALRLPLAPVDPLDAQLSVGSDVWMILAWSVSSDLNHHSRVRRHRKIRIASCSVGC